MSRATTQFVAPFIFLSERDIFQFNNIFFFSFLSLLLQCTLFALLLRAQIYSYLAVLNSIATTTYTRQHPHSMKWCVTYYTIYHSPVGKNHNG